VLNWSGMTRSHVDVKYDVKLKNSHNIGFRCSVHLSFNPVGIISIKKKDMTSVRAHAFFGFFAFPAFPLSFASDFLTWSRRCFFKIMMLNRSKSFSVRRFAIIALFFAHPLFSHFFTVSSFSRCFLMTPLPAPRGSL